MRTIALFICRAVRVLHLAIITAVLPLGLHHALDERIGVGPRIVLFVVAAILALFVLAMDQADYPTTLVGAALRTAPLIATVVVVSTTSVDPVEGVALAAHWSVSSLLMSLFIVLVLAAVSASRSVDPAVQKQRGLVTKLVVPLSAAVLASFAIVSWPLMSTLTLTLTLTSLLVVVSWLVQTTTTSWAWWQQSTFAPPRSRATEMGAWGAPTVVAMFVVLGAFAVVLIW